MNFDRAIVTWNVWREREQEEAIGTAVLSGVLSSLPVTWAK
jgi:hypothetical protein